MTMTHTGEGDYQCDPDGSSPQWPNIESWHEVLWMDLPLVALTRGSGSSGTIRITVFVKLVNSVI